MINKTEYLQAVNKMAVLKIEIERQKTKISCLKNEDNVLRETARLGEMRKMLSNLREKFEKSNDLRMLK
jgi:hypothetical protein